MFAYPSAPHRGCRWPIVHGASKDVLAGRTILLYVDMKSPWDVGILSQYLNRVQRLGRDMATW